MTSPARAEQPDLGAPLATFRAIGQMMAVCIGGGFVVVLGPLALSVQAYGWSSRVLVGLTALIVATVAWCSWMVSIELVFHENGLSYRSLFGSPVIPWDDFESFTLSARKWRTGFRIRTTQYSYLITITSRHRTCLRFGDRFSEPVDLANTLIEMTTERLYLRALRELEAGRVVNFGYIRISRKNGIRMTPLWRSPVTIPLDQVDSYTVSKGHVRIRQRGSEKPVTVPFDCVLNPFALLRLLDVVYSRPTPTVVTVNDWYE